VRWLALQSILLHCPFAGKAGIPRTAQAANTGASVWRGKSQRHHKLGRQKAATFVSN